MARGGSGSGPLGFCCDCGTVRGHLAPAGVRAGTRVVCHCRDCRAAELHFGRADPDPGGVDLFQTTPDAVTIDSGAERLAILRLGPKGLMRWYAACCDTPLFNTLARPTLPFVGIAVSRLAEPDRLGPVRAQGFVPQQGGGTRHEHGSRVVWGVIGRMLSARLSGRWRQTPFFDVETGDPVVQPVVIEKAARARLYD